MADDTMFQEAVDALRRGDKARAKEDLTLLLKSEQTNPTYWIWLSAAVDTPKERIYCLQTALKLDPENATAKRGLILLGALPPDEKVQPFTLNRPRAWEQKLLLSHEVPKPKGVRAIAGNPMLRLAGVVMLGLALIGGAIFLLLLPRTAAPSVPTFTPGPSPTFTATPTVFGATAPPTGTFLGPTPLWMLLPATYTPTPLYVNTPRAPQSFDQYRAAKDAYAKGDWDGFISSMELIATLEPEAADVFYLIGEGYRFKGNAREALFNYNHALEIDDKFGAAYLGLARARLMQEPGVNVDVLFDRAIELDPNYGEAYLERARYLIDRNDPEAALVDLGRAEERMPGSPEVYMTYAAAYIEIDDIEQALEAAERALELDQTSLPAYKLLGELYVQNEQWQDAIGMLETYVPYEDEDATAYALIGRSYFELGDYENAIKNLDRAFQLNPSGLRRYSLYRGLSHLELGNADAALPDLERAYEADDASFEINLALVRVYYLQEKFGSAFQRVEACRVLAETEEETALAHYWKALIQEKREEQKSATEEWQALLKMDPDVMTEQMRAEAELHLRTIVTPTNTPKAGSTTSTPTRTATRTPTPTKTRTPTPTP
ncbi:MAG: tetratricopeptide repeat protein [Chloroflexota bacterium]